MKMISFKFKILSIFGTAMDFDYVPMSVYLFVCEEEAEGSRV